MRTISPEIKSGRKPRFCVRCRESSKIERPWLPSPGPRPEGRPLGILRLFYAQRRAMTTLPPHLDQLIHRAPPRWSSSSDLNRAGPWLTSEAAAVALRAPETSSSPITKVRLREADENPCIRSPLTWRHVLRAQAAAAGSSLRKPRILAEAGRSDPLGFPPDHQLQAHVIGSPGRLHLGAEARAEDARSWASGAPRSASRGSCCRWPCRQVARAQWYPAAGTPLIRSQLTVGRWSGLVRRLAAPEELRQPQARILDDSRFRTRDPILRRSCRWPLRALGLVL